MLRAFRAPLLDIATPLGLESNFGDCSRDSMRFMHWFSLVKQLGRVGQNLDVLATATVDIRNWRLPKHAALQHVSKYHRLLMQE